MKRRWDALKAGLFPDPALPEKQQVFQGLCLLGGVLALGVVVPMNQLQASLSPWVNRIAILFGLELLALAWAARRGHYFKTTAFLSFVIALDALWFPSGGSQSSIGLYFFTAALFLVLLFKGAVRYVGFILLVGNIIGLHLAEKAWPHLAYPYGAVDRLLDLSIGYVLSLVTCSLMLWVVLEGLDQEKGRLTESEQLYRELLERQGEGFSMVDTQERFLVVNPVAEAIFGVGPGGLMGRSLLEFLPVDQQEVVRNQSLLRAQGIHSTYEIQIRREDGMLRTLLLTATPRFTQDGRDFQAIGVFRDITERIQAEETERLLVQERHQSQKMDSLGSLAGGVAHDFNNMLGGIMGYADLLLIGEQDPKRLKYLRAILAAASRSSELTQKLLAFGRRGRNRIESLDLQAMVQDCLEMLRPSMSPDLQVVVAIEGSLRVDGDPSQIHQVFVNLCINAIEAMPERGSLTLTARPQVLAESIHSGLPIPAGSYVELSVADTGIGMTEAVRQRIFEPFFTTKNTSGMSGTGLGLSTAYGIIHAHGGTLTVESDRGRGSTFRVLLPVGALPPAARSPQASGSKGHGLVLLVEDEPLLRELGASVLDSLGYEATTASDGLEAVRIFRARHQDLCAVLLDLKMPRMAGREAFLEILKIDPSVPVIICTGYGENEEVQELLTLGAKGMLAKPYQIATLAAKLRQVTLG